VAKPASGTALDTGHALYTSLTAAWAFLEGTGGTSADSRGTRTATLVSGAWGTDANGDACWDISSAHAGPITLGSALNLAGNGDWSLAFRAKTTNADSQAMVCGDNTNTGDFVWMLNGTALRVRDTAGGDYDVGAPTSFTTEANYVIAFNRTEGGTGKFHFYKDGAEVNTGAGGLNGDHYLNINCIGAGYTSSAFSLIGKISYLYAWSGRTLSSSDASALHSDPYVIFDTGGGAGDTGGVLTGKLVNRGLLQGRLVA
jgi:hypothetical protein